MDNLSLQLRCLPADECITAEQISLCKPFLKHTQSLELDWCVCTEDTVVNLLTSNDKEAHSVRDIRFLSKGRLYGCKGKKKPDAGTENEAVIEAVVEFLELCKNLRKIDLGTNAALCHNVDVMNVIKDKSDQGTLDYVNMSGIYPYCGVFMIPHDRIDTRLSLIKDSLFKTVTEITVDWDSHFEDLVTTVATAPAQVKTLGLTIYPEEFYDYVNPKKTTLTQLWKLLKSNKPEIQIKLNLNELPYRKDDDLDDIRAVFNTEMPLTKLCVVYKMEEFAQIVVRHLKKEKHAANLKEIGFHKVDIIHFHTVPVREVHEVSKLLTDLKCMKGIRKISLSGEFVLLTDLLSVVTQHVDTLKELDVHRIEVVSEKDLVETAIEEEKENRQMKKKRKVKKSKDYDMLTETEVECVAKTVSKMLRKPWKMLRKIPVQMCNIDRYRSFNDMHFLPDIEMFYVMQNKAV